MPVFPCLRLRTFLLEPFRGQVPKKRSKGLAPERLAATERRKSMPLYEHVYLARQDVSPSRWRL